MGVIRMYSFFPLNSRHYCQCVPGYRSYQDPLLNGQTRCVDIDECELGTHSCRPGTQECQNTEGGFRCQCLLANAECTNGK